MRIVSHECAECRDSADFQPIFRMVMSVHLTAYLQAQQDGHDVIVNPSDQYSNLVLHPNLPNCAIEKHCVGRSVD